MRDMRQRYIDALAFGLFNTLCFAALGLVVIAANVKPVLHW